MEKQHLKISNSYREISLLLLIIALAAFLRLYKLGDWSLWVDEAFTIHDALNNPIGNYPVNYLFVRFFLLSFGVSEWIARIGPVIAGIFSIAAAYYFFKRVFDKNTALLGSLFLALSSWHIYWSQNSRHYSLLLLFAILCLHCFYISFESRRPVFSLLSLVILALGIKTHPSIIFLMPALAGYLILVTICKFERGAGYDFRYLLVFFSPIILGSFVFVPKYINNFAGFSSSTGSGSPFHVLNTTVYYVQIPIITLALVTVVYLLAKKDRRGLFLGLVTFVPLLMLIIASMFARASSLYIYYTLPVYCLLSAYFITHLAKDFSSKPNIVAVGISLMLILNQAGHVYFYFTYQYGDRPRWKEAANFLALHTKNEDIMISTAPAVLEYYHIINKKKTPLEYYHIINKKKTPLDYYLRNSERISCLSEKKMNEFISKKNASIWLITNIDLNQIDYISTRSKEWIINNFTIMKNYPAWTAGKNRTVTIYFYDNQSE